jgi:hypothetical protein
MIFFFFLFFFFLFFSFWKLTTSFL